jgi:hypothetical protein
MKRWGALVIVSATYMYCYLRIATCVLRALDVMNANSVIRARKDMNNG